MTVPEKDVIMHAFCATDYRFGLTLILNAFHYLVQVPAHWQYFDINICIKNKFDATFNLRDGVKILSHDSVSIMVYLNIFNLA